jgi:hypothetical protein
LNPNENWANVTKMIQNKLLKKPFKNKEISEEEKDLLYF